MDGGAWWAAVHGVAKSRTWLNDFTFTLHFHALEKEMATHSSVLAWRIPGTGEPGGLPSLGSHRVGHDWSDLAAAAGKNTRLGCHALLQGIFLTQRSNPHLLHPLQWQVGFFLPVGPPRKPPTYYLPNFRALSHWGRPPWRAIADTDDEKRINWTPQLMWRRFRRMLWGRRGVSWGGEKRWRETH